jgi:hypothetical protein
MEKLLQSSKNDVQTIPSVAVQLFIDVETKQLALKDNFGVTEPIGNLSLIHI